MEHTDNLSRAEVMRGHIEACRASGGAVVSYCKAHNLAPSNYYYWQKKLNRAAVRPGFTQVAPMDTGSSTATICYPNGVRLELNNISIAALKELVCCI
ncbi:MAG: hypothetical protein QM640_01245 [Niabella sp.]